jgi:DNA-binding MarR family transcriptional regulator
MASADFPPIRRNDAFAEKPADRTELNPPDAQTLIRAALLSKGLADTRQRAALARRLGLTDNEVLAAQHLARAGELTPGELSALLQLSSAGTTALIHRMQRAGHMTRRAHHRDGRSAIVRLAPDLHATTTEASAPFVAEIDSLIAKLPRDEAAAVSRFLERVAEAAERQVDRLAADADAHARDALAAPLPGPWA